VLVAIMLLAWAIPLRAAWGEVGERSADEAVVATPGEAQQAADGGEVAPSMPRRRGMMKGDDEPPLKVLGEFYPEQARRLRALKERDPEEFNRIEKQMRPWLRELREARGRNPELARLLVQKHRTEMAIGDWQRRYREASAEEREGLMAEGQQLAEQRVDLRLRTSQMEIQILEKRLEGLQKRLKEREGHKEGIVKRELANMVNPPSSQPARSPGSQPAQESP
jgi:hypothetical protein